MGETVSKPFVVAATIAKDRAWALPDWFDAVYRHQAQRPAALFVLLNDCTDDSAAKLRNAFSVANAAQPQWCAYDTLNTGDTGSDRVSPRYSIANLATLRNELLARAVGNWPQLTHLWSCDSDVLPLPDVLEKLLAADVPVCAAVVRNSTAPVYNFWRGTHRYGRIGSPDYTERPYRRGDEAAMLAANTEPSRVTMCGACVLIRRDVIDAGVRYDYHANGEDVAWCMAAREKGVPLYVHPRALTRHIHCGGEEWR